MLGEILGFKFLYRSYSISYCFIFYLFFLLLFFVLLFVNDPSKVSLS